MMISLSSTYKFERQNFRTGRRIAPKFCTHVPIDSHLNRIKKNWPTPPQGGLGGYYMLFVRSFLPSFVRVTAVLAAKRAERHDHARPTAHDHEWPTTHARPRTTTHYHAWPTTHARPRTHNRARTTAHDRPRTHDHARPPYLFEEAVPTPPPGGLNCLARLALARERTPSSCKRLLYIMNALSCKCTPWWFV